MQIGKTIIVLHCYSLMLIHLTRLQLWCLNGDWEGVLKEMVVTLFGDFLLENFAVAVEFPKLSMVANQTTATVYPDNPLKPEIYLNKI